MNMATNWRAKYLDEKKRVREADETLSRAIDRISVLVVERDRHEAEAARLRKYVEDVHEAIVGEFTKLGIDRTSLMGSTSTADTIGMLVRVVEDKAKRRADDDMQLLRYDLRTAQEGAAKFRDELAAHDKQLTNTQRDLTEAQRSCEKLRRLHEQAAKARDAYAAALVVALGGEA
jgi:chromosome segregation ATPase